MVYKGFRTKGPPKKSGALRAPGMLKNIRFYKGFGTTNFKKIPGALRAPESQKNTRFYKDFCLPMTALGSPGARWNRPPENLPCLKTGRPCLKTPAQNFPGRQKSCSEVKNWEALLKNSSSEFPRPPGILLRP